MSEYLRSVTFYWSPLLALTFNIKGNGEQDLEYPVARNCFVCGCPMATTETSKVKGLQTFSFCDKCREENRQAGEWG